MKKKEKGEPGWETSNIRINRPENGPPLRRPSTPFPMVDRKFHVASRQCDHAARALSDICWALTSRHKV